MRLYGQYRPAAAERLLGLAVLGVFATARAELLQREPIGIVALVFFRVIVALFAVGARERDQGPICFLGHVVDFPLEAISEPKVRIELTTSPLPRVCSTTELLGRYRAPSEYFSRTPHLAAHLQDGGLERDDAFGIGDHVDACDTRRRW